MRVPSKSKNAATCGPSGPAYTCARRSDSNTRDLRSVGCVQRLDELGAIDQAGDELEMLGTSTLQALRRLALRWGEQDGVVLEVDRRGEQLTGDRLEAVQAALEKHLLTAP